MTEASPHTRGWTLARLLSHLEHPGFPAHAGMDPEPGRRRRGRTRLPRTRGDGPSTSSTPGARSQASPHTRGWTRDGRGVRSLDGGFPAHAGMDPPARASGPRGSRLPRTRGDGPRRTAPSSTSMRASPHTRGWTRQRPLRPAGAAGFPAHAGMDPIAGCGSTYVKRLPRTRGDGPRWLRWCMATLRASPHTRGWTPLVPVPVLHREGFPAHAGMDPRRTAASASSTGLPRTRGDGPPTQRTRRHDRRASPHTRGWTRHRLHAVQVAAGFPAHAGMDPRRRRFATASARLPRTRGDGPDDATVWAALQQASPHTRGWTRRAAWLVEPHPGFPAHAGMDPWEG